MEESNNQDFINAVSHDLEVMKTLKLRVVSGEELYGAIVGVVLSLAGLLSLINLTEIVLLHLFGLCPWPYLVWIEKICGLNLACSCFIGMGIWRTVLFNKLAKGHLKSVVFIRKKCVHIMRLFFMVNAVLYLIGGLIAGSSEYAHLSEMSGWDRSWMESHFFLAQALSFIASLVFSIFAANMEITRLGVTPMFNLMSDFMDKSKGKTSSNTENGNRE